MLQIEKMVPGYKFRQKNPEGNMWYLDLFTDVNCSNGNKNPLIAPGRGPSSYCYEVEKQRLRLSSATISDPEHRDGEALPEQIAAPLTKIQGIQTF